MILGCDVSHWNEVQQIKTSFACIKASEGRTYLDPKRNEWVKKLSTIEPIPYIIFYHFARPDKNTPAEEFQNFAEAVDGHKGFGVALDWEDTALNYGSEWALDWLQRAEAFFETKPFFYVQASSAKKYSDVIAKYPLWCACYSQDSRTGKYKDVCDKAKMLQVTSHPLDIDVFMGTETELQHIILGV